MLSILIPIYNYDVRKLVSELHRQAEELLIDFEILAYEDGSTQYLNENNELTNLNYCLYKQYLVNVGRAKIRNQLAREAKFEHFLFLDCDSEIPDGLFLKRYMVYLNKDLIVLGGRIYNEKIEPEYSLLKKYGRKREQNHQHNQKRRTTYPMFTTPNFLIPKKAFDCVKFNEKVVGYGHEDTLFGIELRRKGFKYIFIDNPIIHVGIETNSVFLRKTREALENLYRIYKSKHYPEIENESKILRTYIKIKPLEGLFHLIYVSLHRMMEKSLHSSHPSLLLFDFYKLTYLCHYAKNQ